MERIAHRPSQKGGKPKSSRRETEAGEDAAQGLLSSAASQETLQASYAPAEISANFGVPSRESVPEIGAMGHSARAKRNQSITIAAHTQAIHRARRHSFTLLRTPMPQNSEAHLRIQILCLQSATALLQSSVACFKSENFDALDCDSQKLNLQVLRGCAPPSLLSFIMSPCLLSYLCH